MASNAAATVSIVERVRPVPVDGAVSAVLFIGSLAAFALGEEALVLADQTGATRRIAVHGGAILATASFGTREILTAGDDGRICATDAEGSTRVVGTDAKRRWIDHLAAGPSSAVAWSAGRSVVVRSGTGEEKTLELSSSPGGLAWAPKGFRLAVAHYDGATLWFPNAAAAPERLEWKGSHLGVTFSPDGRFLVTTMQEPMLHGWRLADGKHMRMSGYSAKVRSLDWTADGRSLATSGSEQLILWPFGGKDGPMGAQPRMLAPMEARVTQVRCHPQEAVTAVGYAEGTVLLVRLEDGAEIIARRPDGSAVSALGWSATGDRLGFGTEGGDAGVVVL